MLSKIKTSVVATLAATLFSAGTAAAAYNYTYFYGDSYGSRITSPCVTNALSGSTTNVYIDWDSAGYLTKVRGFLLDTGRCDGQVAKFRALLYYMDGTNSGWKEVATTGVETTAQPFSRQFAPSKRVAGVQLQTCRYSAAAGDNACGAISPSPTQYWDNPNT